MVKRKYLIGILVGGLIGLLFGIFSSVGASGLIVTVTVCVVAFAAGMLFADNTN
ncbi:MAG TPA: hypothetical protein V6C57_21065 [Coleofasciculaceae cyanobacterium]